MDDYKIQKRIVSFLVKVFFTASLFLSAQSVAFSDSVEYKIKAAYLYNFTKFISWPDNPSETFNLCIFGKDPFGSIINPIESRTVKNKPIRLFRYNSIKDIKACHIIYFGDITNTGAIAEASFNGILSISSFKNAGVDTEKEYFKSSGGMIAFILKQGKVKLHINVQSLRKSGLEVSAKLLEVAEVYEGESDD